MTILASKKKLQFAGNCVSMVTAGLVVIVFFLFQQQQGAVNKVGSWILSAYERPYLQEVEQALDWLHEGQLNSVVALLESGRWQSIQLGDRVYLQKRQVIRRLCEELTIATRYENLNYWSGIWRNLDERDVTAIAYWYESVRHMPGRAEEGRRGLQQAWQRFPQNPTLTRFYAAVLWEVGDTTTLRSAIGEARQKSLVAMRKGWRIHFGKHARDVLPALGKQLFDEIDRMQWDAAKVSWSMLQREVFDSKVRRERRRGRRTVKVAITPEPEGRSSIALQVPANITRLRIEPPETLKLVIGDIRLTMMGRTYKIPINAVHHKGIKHHHGRLEVVDSASQIVFVVPDSPRSLGANLIEVELSFKVELSNLGMESFTNVRSSQ